MDFGGERIFSARIDRVEKLLIRGLRGLAPG